jgi:hypothetical protein
VDPVGKFYMHTIDRRGSSLSSLLQHRILTVGVRQRCDDLLAALCRVDDLDDDVVAALRDVRSAKVRAAWVARSGTGPDAVRGVLRSEKRIMVLEAAARRNDLSDGDYLAMIRSGHERISHAVLTNPAVSAVARSAAAAAWCAAVSDMAQRDLRSAAEAIVSHHPECANSLAEHARHPAILTATICSDLTPAAQANLLTYLVRPVLGQLAAFSAGSASLSWDTTKRIERLTEHLPRALSAPGATDEFRDGVAAVLHALGPLQPQRGAIPNPERLRQRLLSAATEARGSTVNPLSAARHSTDPAELDQLALAAANDFNQMLAMTLFANPNLPASAARVAMTVISWVHLKGALEQSARCGNGTVFAVIAAANSQLINDDVLSLHDDPPALLRGTVAAMTKPTAHHAAAVLNSRFCDSSVLFSIPADMLLTSSQGLPGHVAEELRGLLDSHLGGDDSAWAVFEALLADGGLTLGELLQVSSRL